MNIIKKWSLSQDKLHYKQTWISCWRNSNRSSEKSAKLFIVKFNFSKIDNQKLKYKEEAPDNENLKKI